MKKPDNKGWSFLPLIFIISAVLICLGMLSVKYYLSFPVEAIIQLVLSAGAIVLSMVYIFKGKASMMRLSRTLVKQQSSHSELFEGLSLPMAVFTDDSEIVWYNELFRTVVLKGHDIYGADGATFIDRKTMNALNVSGRSDIEYSGRRYTAYCGGFLSGEQKCTAVYFADDTELKNTSQLYLLGRPVAIIASIDSLDELTDGLPESDQAGIRVNIEKEIEKWAEKSGGMVRRFGSNRYIIAMDEKGLEIAKESKFDLLDRVRTVNVNGRGCATLSVGVGHGGASFRECEAMAAQALDMAFGRGGDQVAVKDLNGFEFFGGVSSKGSERRTKVRTRVIAAALRELIEGSDNIFITGHRFADLDCVGAAFGLWRAVTEIGKPCHIVIDRQKNLAGPLINEIVSDSGENVFASFDTARTSITKKSLLIVVDVHRADFVDFPDLCKICPTIVVIDHHRKTVDYINNSLIFYHEPYASSACEMVSELLQYMGVSQIGRTEANALLSGIMLDTRNFVLRTGVRTFEASAFLRSCGADPVEVKHYFAGSMEIYRERSAIVSAAEIYKNCAISFNETDDENCRIASAQAADELLNIENVDASFVLFKTGTVMNISARSMGKVNVQLIMEQLGGGGHHTMAAAQLEGFDEEESRAKLIEAIGKVVQ